jgi:hypothetical protein
MKLNVKGGPKGRNSAAADHFEVRLLLDGLQNVPSENAYPSPKPPAELRSKQSDTLRQALVLEEKAMESLRKSY